MILTILFTCPDSRAETNGLDLIILQNPERELKNAIKKGFLEKVVRAIKLIEQGKINLAIFKDQNLLEKASKREIKNNCHSKKYQFFRGALWTTLAAIILFPAGATKEEILVDYNKLDYSPLMIKGLLLMMNMCFLRLAKEGKSLMISNARLVNQLVKKYHQKSLAN